MRGGFLISGHRDLYRRAAEVLAVLGREARDDGTGRVVQVTDAGGRLFTLYEDAPGGAEWDVFGGPGRAEPGVAPVDLASVTACQFDCRWPELVAQLASLVSAHMSGPVWLLDGDDVLWDASSVDIARLRL